MYTTTAVPAHYHYNRLLSMVEFQSVQLSDLKFVKPGQSQRPYPDPSSNDGQTTRDYPHVVLDHPLGGAGSTPYDRLAADKPGEELAPEGAIWKMYVDEAKEHDSELVDGKNRNLDMMLLFAALFSAILTAFLIESKNLLQEDPADLSVTLLFAIAQSQQRMEQGNPQILPLIERPTFTASMSARWINGLWFTALTLSLSAALVAMLAKEWLTAFIAFRPRPALSHALLHQERLQGLVQWGALHIVDFLPTMLHISLLLFFLGLAIYLWTLDFAVAIAEIILAGATLIFYITTGILGALNESCPFATQTSKYLRVLLASSSGIQRAPEGYTGNRSVGTETTDGQLQALSWLIGNTRDPAVGDCACQALAGIHVSPKTNSEEKTETSRRVWPVRAKPSRQDLLSGLYDAVRTRLVDIRLRLPQEPVENQGLRMAQYASAMPALVYSLGADGEIKQEAGQESSQPFVKSSVVSAFEAMDTIWTNDCPGLTPDAYAILAAAELRLIRAVTLAHHTKPATVHSFRVIGILADDISSSENDEATEGWSMIEMQDVVSTSTGDSTSLFQLRARYSRSLARVGYLLSYHNKYNVTITARPLAYLVESIRLTTLCNDLNTDSHLSTCLPQSKNSNTLPGFDVDVFSDGRSHSVDPLDVGDEDGIVAGLVQVIASAGIQNTPSVELAAGRSLEVVGPVLLRQWVCMMNRSSEVNTDRSAAGLRIVEQVLKHWPKDRNVDEFEAMAHWTLNQLLVIAVISVSLADCPQMSDLSDIACAALCQRAMTASGRAAMFVLGEDHDQLLSELVRSVHLHQTRLRPDTPELLLRLLLTDISNRSLFRSRAMHSSGLPDLLRILAIMRHVHLEEVQKLLRDLDSLLREEVDAPYLPNKFLLVFTRTAEGFTTLSNLAHYQEYVSAVIECIMNVVHVTYQFSQLRRRDSSILARAVPGLLDAVKIVVIKVALGEANMRVMELLPSFMLEVIGILHTLNPRARNAAQGSPEMETIYDVLRDMRTYREELTVVVEGLEAWGDIDTVRLEGLDQLFNGPQP
ncbi:hypothetical protein FRC07_009182 [Ceratobasidium sp. 392]|nr:hypothetical protein FRC07_009182 [Ceratobasidium sp. 392]